MKEFENKIYRRLLAPVLACLVLALAGCSQDATEEEAPSSPTGDTYLTIVTRGINTTDDTQYEDYVKTLRVIIFDDAGNSIANLFLQNTDDDTDEIPDHTPEIGDETEVLLDEQNIGQISSGTYTFYCIANETGYSNIDGKSLSTILGVDKNISEEDLDDMQVKFTENDIRKPTGTDKYMLMSMKQNFLIRAGEEKPITIVLDRALAKAQLVIQSTDKITDNISVSLPKDKIPASYSLIKQGTIGSSSFTLGEDVQLDPTTDKPFYDKAESENNQYVSEVVYLPERSATSADDALYYSITIGGNTYNNVASIADGITDATKVNYNIIRNFAYTTICTYSQPATLSLTYTVQPWGTGGGKHDFN